MKTNFLQWANESINHASDFKTLVSDDSELLLEGGKFNRKPGRDERNRVKMKNYINEI